jgi:hypothetical protein
MGPIGKGLSLLQGPDLTVRHVMRSEQDRETNTDIRPSQTTLETVAAAEHSRCFMCGAENPFVSSVRVKDA